jgi:hypothetical protein
METEAKHLSILWDLQEDTLHFHSSLSCIHSSVPTFTYTICNAREARHVK